MNAADRRTGPPGVETAWGRKAADLYGPAYARRYRAHDDSLQQVEAYRTFCQWLGEVCEAFDAEIDVLDVGCGTGRYFAALKRVRRLTGLDASPAMLAEAGRPVDAARITARSIELVTGDVLTHEFAPESFDLVYAIGVLAEHTPFDDRVASRIVRWLRPGGRFAFTTVHPDSPSVARTALRSAGRALLPWLVGWPHEWLHAKLTGGGAYADEAWIRGHLSGLALESIRSVESEAHLHCLVVARKGA